MKIKTPICPILLFFKGDEWKCNTSKCDYNRFSKLCTMKCNVKKFKKSS